jgi:RNA polymerase sigma-70 factor (ECF subfamily)
VRFAFSLTRDSEAAADLAQDTIAKALGAAWRFTPGTNLAAWLFRILRNLHLNRVRDGAARPRIESLQDLREAADPDGRLGFNPVEKQAIERASLAAVRQAFNKLPERYAVPIHLVCVEELSYAETAAILSVPVGTVMSRIYRGRKLLVAGLAGGWR